MTIREIVESDRDHWVRLRDALWPGSLSDHEAETRTYFEKRPKAPIIFVAEAEGRLVGFLELDYRPYAPGCKSSPVPFIEGWYVERALQGRGIGRALVEAAEAHARAAGHDEIASDAEIENTEGVAAHRALGYEEVERIVCFRRSLANVRLALVLACVLATPLPPARALARNEPELPRVLLDTPYAPPTRGKLIPVNAGGDLQAALHAAQPGDVIELQAGATFIGNFILPRKTGTDWIHVRSSAHERLPHPGTRVFPSHASLMPRIETPNRSPAIRTAAAAHHYRFVGIEVTARGETRSTGPYSDNNVVYLESEGGQTTLGQVPTDIIFDRCYVHGSPTGSVRRGIAMNGARMAVVDSYLSDFHEVGADSQAVSVWNGPGPFKIVNNYLEGAGENLMFGGADPSIPDLVPSDIEVRGNHLFKPLSWKIGHPTYAGTPWSVKNIFELKNARRVLAEGNLLEYNWRHDQNGFAILFTVRNQDGAAPWCTVEDVTFRKNVLRHSGGGFNILAADNNFPSGQARRILIQDNLLDDISSVNWGGTGRLFQFLSLDSRDTGILELTVEHNTGFSNAWSAYTGDKPIAVHRSFTFRNNIAPKRIHGFAGGTKSWPSPSPIVTGDGSQTLNTFYVAPVFAGNVLVGSTPADYSRHPGNFFPATDADVGFVDLARSNYRLGPASPYKNAATDGKDPGAAIDALEAATAGAASGGWPPASSPRP